MTAGDSNYQSKQAKKKYLISEYLKKHPKVPTAEMFIYGEVDGVVYTVQKFIPGEIPREKKFEIDHLKHLAKILAYLHSINVKGGGYLKYELDTIKGTHKDWYTFLRTFIFKCFNNIQGVLKNKSPLNPSNEDYKRMKNKLEVFFRKYKGYFESVNGRLLHGDLGKGNILMGDSKINALIDIDFPVAGDPAWEFALRDHFPKEFFTKYLTEMKILGVDIPEDEFRFRIALYEPLMRLVITNSLISESKDIEKTIKKLHLFEKLIDKVL